MEKEKLVPYALNLPEKTLKKMNEIAKARAIPPAVFARSLIVKALAAEA